MLRPMIWSVAVFHRLLVRLEEMIVAVIEAMLDPIAVMLETMLEAIV